MDVCKVDCHCNVDVLGKQVENHVYQIKVGKYAIVCTFSFNQNETKTMIIGSRKRRNQIVEVEVSFISSLREIFQQSLNLSKHN